MPSLNKLVRPELPEGRASHLEEGFITGWVPGEITSLDDPEKIGRVRVRADLIQQNNDLPNVNDGWVWVLEEFVNNAMPGGTHRLLKVGTQVALLPMMGDPRQMLLLGCLPSRVDRPHEELDRSRETYGRATPGQVLTVHNDAEASRVDSFPHGVFQFVSGEGDMTYETADHARMQLMHDGTSKIENDKAYTVITPEGDVSAKSAKGAKSILTADGRVEISSIGASTLVLDKSQGKIEGPASDLTGVLDQLKSVSGSLGLGKNLLGQLPEAVSQMVQKGNGRGFLSMALPVLGKLDSLVPESIGKGLDVLGGLAQGQKFSPAELGRLLLPQAESLLGGSNLAQFIPRIQSVLEKGLTPENILSELRTFLPDDINEAISQIEPLLNGVSHNPQLMLQTILSKAVPGGFDAIKNVIGMGMESSLNQIEGLLSEVLPEPSSETFALAVDKRAQAITSALPQSLTANLDPEVVQNIVKLSQAGSQAPLQLLLGNLSQQTAVNSLNQLKEAKPLADAIKPLKGLTEAVIEENAGKATQQIQELKQVGEQLGGLFSSGKTVTGEIVLGQFEQKLKDVGGLEQFNSFLQAGGIQEQVQELLSGKGLQGSITGLLGNGDIQRRFNELIAGAGLSGRINQLFTNTGVGEQIGRLLNGIGLEEQLDGVLNSGSIDELLSMNPQDMLKSATEQLLPQAMGTLTERLGPVLNLFSGSLNQVLNAIPDGGLRSVVRASQQIVEAETPLGKLGATMVVLPTTSQLVGPLQLTRVYSQQESAGVSTPYGSFGIGPSGGSLFTMGVMAMRVLQGGFSSGMLLHPEKGVSISSFFGGGEPDPKWNDENDFSSQELNQSARLAANGQTAVMQSLSSGGGVHHQLLVSPDGVFVDNRDISNIWSSLDELTNSLASLSAKVAQLSAPPPAPTTGETTGETADG